MMGSHDPRHRDPKLDYLRAMGIQAWSPRSAEEGMVEAPLDAAPEDPRRSEEEIAALDWEPLERAVAACQRCELHRTRTQTVFGVGHRQAEWLIIGEAPGAEEDRQGEPFVGRAGQLLNAMLQAAGFERSQVFIANILKCRPPNNRDPRPAEAQCCRPYLMRQIALLQPRLILAVGRIAAQRLLGSDAPLGRLRGRVHQFGTPPIPLVATYHPAYLLRSPAQKRKAWQDLVMALKLGRGEAA